jgi:hypothetical protein
VRRASIDYQALPVAIHQQKPGVGFSIILNAEFHKDCTWHWDVADEILDYAVLSKLGEYLELCLVNGLIARVAYKRRVKFAKCQLEFILLDQQPILVKRNLPQ